MQMSRMHLILASFVRKCKVKFGPINISFGLILRSFPHFTSLPEVLHYNTEEEHSLTVADSGMSLDT